MKKGYTHIGLVLDASGSMTSLQEDIKGTLRTFAEEQLKAKDPGETIVLDVWQFSNDVKHIIDAKPIDAYDPSLYRCSGGTALYDAVCIGVDSLGHKFAAMREDERPEDVLFVIVTDGYENSSREYRLADVKNGSRRRRTSIAGSSSSSPRTSTSTRSAKISESRIRSGAKVSPLKTSRPGCA